MLPNESDRSVSCPLHPRYLGVGKPRTCKMCWNLYYAKRDMFVAALFVDANGVYSHMPGVDCWDEKRDARLYTGPHPVVAHPPCQLWGSMANVNFKRYGGEHNRPGNDGGCFESALGAILCYGGVLEHPANSKAFAAHDVPRPHRRWPKSVGGERMGWQLVASNLWVCEVSQCAYGHKARKRTWLIYCGKQPPFDLDWSEPQYTHQIGHDSKMKRPRPSLGKREASATPQPFADVLVKLARHSRVYT